MLLVSGHMQNLYPLATAWNCSPWSFLGSSVPLPTFKEVVSYSRFNGSLVAINFNAVPQKKGDGKHTAQKPVVDASIATDYF